MKILSGIILILFLSDCYIAKAVSLPDASSSFYNKTILNSDTINRNPVLKIDTFALTVIPPSTGVHFYKDGIVFLSNSKVENKMLTNHISFGTLQSYYTVLVNNAPGNHQVFSSSDLYAVPSEGMTFNSDFSVMYFVSRSKKKKGSEKIYQATYQFGKNGEGVWISDPKPLSICSDNSTYTHPALSSSGAMLVFSSDRKGSTGGLDLYVSHKNGPSWSEPENLGSNINSTSSEIFSFLDKENNLYFSSDRQKGNGGYDIYICKFNGTNWDKPINLTNQINTSDDDLAFTISSKDGKSALFTRRQKSDKLSLKLYLVTFRDRNADGKFANLSNALKYISGIAKTETESVPAVMAAAQKQEPVEKKKVQLTEPAKKAVSEPVQTQKQKAVTYVPAVNKPSVSDNGVIYRIQFHSNAKPKGSYKLNIADKTYITFEYLYNGAYRSCVGEFSTLSSAKTFQKIIRQQGYTDAFVVAFKNGIRSLDPALFK